MDCTVESTESPADRDRRVDFMLREMVVEEALLSLERGRSPRRFTLEEVADFVGVAPQSIMRLEESALEIMKEKMKKSMI